MNTRRAIEWAVAILLILLAALFLHRLYPPHEGVPRNPDAKIKSAFRAMTSYAHQYMLESGSTSAEFKEIREYIHDSMFEYEPKIDWTTFTLEKNQKVIAMESKEGVTYIYDIESNRLTKNEIQNQSQ